MYNSLLRYCLLSIAISLFFVGCSSVPVESGVAGKPTRFVEQKTVVKTPIVISPIVQLPQSTLLHENSTNKQTAIVKKNSNDNAVNKNQAHTDVDTKQIQLNGDRENTVKIIKASNPHRDKKYGVSDKKHVNIVNRKIDSPKKKRSDSKPVKDQKNSSDTVNKIAFKSNQPEKIKIKAISTVTQKNIIKSKGTVDPRQKNKPVENKIIKTESTESIADNSYTNESQLTGDNSQTAYKAEVPKEEPLLKEDVREKSDLLVSIEVSSSAYSNDGSLILYDLEPENNNFDDSSVDKRENLFLDTSGEGLLDPLISANEDRSISTVKEIAEYDIESDALKGDEGIANIQKESPYSEIVEKKTALLKVKEDVLSSLAKEQDFKSEVFDIVKQANNIISDSSKKNITDSLADDINKLLSLDWNLFVPSKTQYSNSKFSHCFNILDQMRDGQYEVQPPFKIDALDIDNWEQRLDGVTFVQISHIELELYTVSENGVAFNAVSTLFNTNGALSTLIPGVNNYGDQFFGLFVYSDVNQQSVGGAGRFYSVDQLKNLQAYLIKWDSHYYSLSIDKTDNRHNIMEVIPLLSSQQQHQRNCRWRS